MLCIDCISRGRHDAAPVDGSSIGLVLMPKFTFKRLLPLVQPSAQRNLQVRALTEQELFSEDEFVTFDIPTDSPIMPALREGDAMLMFLVVEELRDVDDVVVFLKLVMFRHGDVVVVVIVGGVGIVISVIFTISTTFEVLH